MSEEGTADIVVFWFRRDLRLHDNAGLYHALRSGAKVFPLFIFDRNILDKLENKDDPRVTFIYDQISILKKKLNALGSDIIVKYGEPEAVWKEVISQYKVKEVYANEDYEPYAQKRDGVVRKLLKVNDIKFSTFKDQVIFSNREILTGQNNPYTVFTPYSRAWKQKCNAFYLSSYPTEKHFSALQNIAPAAYISLEEMGFHHSEVKFPSPIIATDMLEKYKETRDFPGIDGTSRLGIHLRFGTVSIRDMARKAFESSEVWLNELIWRDFYQQILVNFPHIGEGKSFRPEYDRIQWRNNEAEFKLWCEGRTGYPLVDAGMRELNASGYMHNRVRMVTASFLTKHLLIDWRWGEAYFAEKLLDFDMAANNGGWQWAAGCGTDAAPYFRIFNPTTQAEKFDPKGLYIRKWVPEFNSLNYPEPIVDHKFARERCLRVYKAALGGG